VIAALVTLAVLASASAPVPAGELTKAEARAFIVRNLPAAAPEELLKDGRAIYYETTWLRVERARRCDRHSRSVVSCRFKLVMEAEVYDGRTWWPIRCKGTELVASFSDGGTGGKVYDYVCWSVRP
jgi:hypothetical protein